MNSFGIRFLQGQPEECAGTTTKMPCKATEEEVRDIRVRHVGLQEDQNEILYDTEG